MLAELVDGIINKSADILTSFDPKQFRYKEQEGMRLIEVTHTRSGVVEMKATYLIPGVGSQFVEIKAKKASGSNPYKFSGFVTIQDGTITESIHELPELLARRYFNDYQSLLTSS